MTVNGQLNWASNGKLLNFILPDSSPQSGQSRPATLGRYPIFVSFKKQISIPAIQNCNICHDITVSTRPASRLWLYASLNRSVVTCRKRPIRDIRSMLPNDNRPSEDFMEWNPDEDKSHITVSGVSISQKIIAFRIVCAPHRSFTLKIANRSVDGSMKLNRLSPLPIHRFWIHHR